VKNNFVELAPDEVMDSDTWAQNAWQRLSLLILMDSLEMIKRKTRC